MPIMIDKKPGRKPLRRNGEEAGPVVPAAPPEPKPTIRVRMLRDINVRVGSFLAGKSYDLEPITARSWIGFGFAEQDKALDRANEIK